MVLPLVVVMILMGRYILEASLNRQDVAVFARGGTVAAAEARSTSFLSCDFDRQEFSSRTDVDQTESIRCDRRSAERGLSRERPFWDAAEDGAADWREILRDVRPARATDILGRGQATMEISNPAFLSQQSAVASAQSFLWPEERLWTHGENPFRDGHDRVIWDEICLRGTYWLFPGVFPQGGGPRC